MYELGLLVDHLLIPSNSLTIIEQDDLELNSSI